jgi:two-component system, OmpR family, sensor kinase
MHLTIRSKLSLQFGLVMALVIVILSTYLYFEVRTEILSAVDQGLLARSAQIEGTITRATGVVAPHSRYFDRDQAFVQVFSGSLRLVDASQNVSGTPMLPVHTISSVPHSAFFTVTLLRDTPVRILVVRYPQAGLDGFVLVGQNLTPTRRSLSRLFTHYLIAGALAVAAVLAIVWLSVRSTLRPVERIRREAKVISATEPNGRLSVPESDDELSRLSRTLNEMLDRMRSATEHERRFIMFASHELRTPLTVLRTELDLALSQPRTPDELRAALVSAGEETDRLARLSTSLITLAAIERDPLSTPLSVQNVSALVASVCDSLTDRALSLGVGLTVGGEDTWTSCDPIQVRHAVTNMVDNALRYGPAGSVVSVTTQRLGGAVRIAAEDAGAGFPEDFLPRAFEPFARVGDSEGTGLGLAIVAAVALSHGGRVWAENLPSGGARVSLEIPDFSVPRPGSPSPVTTSRTLDGSPGPSSRPREQTTA